MNNMPTPKYDVSLNNSGRLRLPKQVRERHGYEYRLIVQNDKLIVVPIYIGEYKPEWIQASDMPVIYKFEITEELPRKVVPSHVRDELGTEYELIDKTTHLEMVPKDVDEN